ncbi:MAG: hypothetical protein K2N43_02325 [Lachnospiraceae bacterium]|nr:hypothetical protein [Lachnospiraceae bacterium]
MSRGNLCGIKSQPAPRLGFDAYNITRERYLEMRDDCAKGKCSPEILQKACKGFEFIAPWILLSVTKSLSYEGLQRLWELREIERMACGRSDFYGYRRKFYHNLDVILMEECSA